MQIKSQKPKQSLLTFFIRLATTNSLSPGIYENINLQSINTNDISRTGTTVSKVNNNSDVWIPGMGILYKINEDYNVFQVFTKAFLSRANVGEDAESSINSELGFRFRKNAFTVN
jgi:Fe(3+) dicitrate transport protein